MFTILIINQKGGVGKTTIADELAFALERKGETVSYISTDPQGGGVYASSSSNEANNDGFQIVDTAGVLTDNLNAWCHAANIVVIPMLPSSRDLEPTLRTYELAVASQTDAKIGFVINGYFSRGILDRQLKEHLTEQEFLVWAEIPKTVALPQAAAMGISIAEYDPNNPVADAFNKFADIVIKGKNKKNK